MGRAQRESVGVAGAEGDPPGELGLLEVVFDRLGAGVYVVDAEGRVRLTNPLAGRLLGYTAEQMASAPAHDLFHHIGLDGAPRSADRCPLLRVASTGTAAQDEDDVFVRADGSLLPVAWDATPLFDGSDAPAGAVVVFRDTTLRSTAETSRMAELALAADERDASRAEKDRVTFLARVTEALGSTLDAGEAVTRLARLVVPRFADWCVIDVVEGGVVRRAALTHRSPDLLEAVGDIAGLVLPPLAFDDRSSLGLALLGGPAQIVAVADLPERSATALGRAQDELFRRLGAQGAIVVGLAARQHVIGAITLARTDPGWAPTAADVVMAEDIGRRAAMALDNIRLYEEQRGTAEALQRTLLPELPHVDGLELCATYTATRQSAEVGGDWYDAIPVDPARTLLVLGDVAGHDLQAAVAMSAIRNHLRAATLHSDDPAAILSEVDEAMARFVDTTATVVVACIDRSDPDRPVLAWSNAGHHAPLLAGPDGIRFLEEEPDVLLGVAPGMARTVHTRPLELGSTLVLYTDGLVERRDVDIEVGMERLRAAVALGRQPVAELCASVVSALDDDWDDDIAVMAVTVTPHPPIPG